jgi:hypothetical protein
MLNPDEIVNLHALQSLSILLFVIAIENLLYVSSTLHFKCYCEKNFQDFLFFKRGNIFTVSYILSFESEKMKQLEKDKDKESLMIALEVFSIEII